MTEEERVEVLLRACDQVQVDVDLLPEYSAAGELLRTFCNLAAQRVAAKTGCDELDLPKVEENADMLYAIMAKNASRRWKRGTGVEAAAHALGGCLAFACAPGSFIEEKHGHICAVRPEATQRSGSLGRDVPILANVGKGRPDAPLVPLGRGGLQTRPNWACKTSQAFPVKKGEPCYFLFCMEGPWT